MLNGLLTLDFVGKRYSKLPSEILESGSTIDIDCAILGQKFENWSQKNAQQVANGEKVDHNLSQEKLQQMMDGVKNAKKSNK